MRCEALFNGQQCPDEATHIIKRVERGPETHYCCLHFERHAAGELAAANRPSDIDLSESHQKRGPKPSK
jgi:hypothetical protein